MRKKEKMESIWFPANGTIISLIVVSGNGEFLLIKSEQNLISTLALHAIFKDNLLVSWISWMTTYSTVCQRTADSMVNWGQHCICLSVKHWFINTKN